MEKSSELRRVDELGRVVIPREIRETLGWQARDEVSFHITEDNALLLRRSTLTPLKKSQEQ